MYFAGTAQPPVADGPAHETTLYTLDEKHLLADLVAARTLDLPLVLDHAERYRTGSDDRTATPTQAKIGRIDGAMVDSKGNLIMIGHMQWDAPETRAVVEQVNQHQVRYGLSLASTLERSDATVHSKKPDHVGLTRDPEFGDRGTWLHYGALTPDGLLPRLRELMNEPGMYVPSATRANIESMLTLRETKSHAPIRDASENVAPASRRLIVTTASRMADQMDVVPPASTNTNAATPAPVAAAVSAPVAAAAAAPAPAAPAAMSESQWREFLDMRRVVEEKFSKLPPTIDLDDLNRAIALKAAIDALVERAGITKMSHVPDQVRETHGDLIKFLSHTQGLLKATANKQATNESDRLALHTFIDKPAEYRPALVSIAASHNTEFFINQRVEEEKLQREIELKKRSEEDAKREEQWNARKRALEEKEQEVSTKRQRLTVQPMADGTVTIHTGAGAAAGPTTTVTTTAARAPTDKINALSSHWHAHLGPVIWLQPDVADPRLMADEYTRNVQSAISRNMMEVFHNKAVLAEYSKENTPRY